MSRRPTSSKQEPTTRQLKVGEVIRHALSMSLHQGRFHELERIGASVTISEVKMSPDLQHATVYIMPLGGKQSDEVLDALTKTIPKIRSLLAKQVKLRRIPTLYFVRDNSFDVAHNIDKLIHSLNDPDDL
jgi:ribosome-binding factor A